MAGINKQKDEYTKRADAVADVVTRNMTTDPNATINATKKIGASLQNPLGGIGGKVLNTIASNVSLEKPLGGLGEKAMGELFPYGLEGSIPQRERAVKEGLTAEGQPMGPDMQERLRTGVGPDVTKKTIAEESAAAVPVAAIPSVEAPVPVGGTGPWSQGKRNEYLGLNEGKIVKGGGPGGTDLLTNRDQPFTQPKELPQEAYGVGGSKEKEAMVQELKNNPFGSVAKMNLAAKAMGIGEGITPTEQKRLDLEEKRIQQQADQFAKTHDMTQRHNQEQIAMQMGGFTETEVPDPAGTGTIKQRTPNPEFFMEAFDEQGNFSLQNAVKSVEESKTLQNAKAVLAAKGNDPSVAKDLKERLSKRGISESKIKSIVGI